MVLNFSQIILPLVPVSILTRHHLQVNFVDLASYLSKPGWCQEIQDIHVKCKQNWKFPLFCFTLTSMAPIFWVAFIWIVANLIPLVREHRRDLTDGEILCKNEEAALHICMQYWSAIIDKVDIFSFQNFSNITFVWTELLKWWE